MKHIALIGIDGSGKSTLAKQLFYYLKGLYNDKVMISRSDRMNSSVLKEVERRGNYKVGDDLRLTAYAFDLALKYLQLVPKLDLEFIIWDRYYYCLYAYFSALNVDLTHAREVTSIMPVPDYTFLLDIDVTTAVERIGRRTTAQKKEENDAYLKKVREEYSKMAKDSRIIPVNAASSKEEVLHSVLSHIL